MDESRSQSRVKTLRAPALDESWAAVIPSLPVLDPLERAVVACSARPLQVALPGLIDANATIHLLPLCSRTADVDELGLNDNQRASDGRRLAGIGGLASGRGVAVARIESLLLIGHHWVFAHELSHLAYWSLPAMFQDEFERLFAAAQQVPWAFTEYQLSNIDEFFAVSYEELLMERHGGKPVQRDAAGMGKEVVDFFHTLEQIS